MIFVCLNNSQMCKPLEIWRFVHTLFHKRKIHRLDKGCYVSQCVHRMIKRINGSAGLIAVFVGFPNIVPVFFYRVGAVFRDAHIINLLNNANTKVDAVRTLDTRLHVN